MDKERKRRAHPAPYSAYRYCIFAVHRNDKGIYWYDPKYKMFFRGFRSELTRQQFWRTIIEASTVAEPRRAYRVSLVDVRGRTAQQWKEIGAPRYADSPIIDAGVSHRRIKVGLVNCSRN